MKIIRQGDLIIKQINKLPDNLEAVEVQSFILAEGEITGHKHLITAEPQTKMRIIKDKEGRHYIEIKEGGAVITHEEHKTIYLTPGFYVQEIKEEFDYFLETMRQVKD